MIPARKLLHQFHANSIHLKLQEGAGLAALRETNPGEAWPRPYAMPGPRSITATWSSFGSTWPRTLDFNWKFPSIQAARDFGRRARPAVHHCTDESGRGMASPLRPAWPAVDHSDAVVVWIDLASYSRFQLEIAFHSGCAGFRPTSPTSRSSLHRRIRARHGPYVRATRTDDGFNTGTPLGRKRATLKVTSVRPRSRAVAATRRSAPS